MAKCAIGPCENTATAKSDYCSNCKNNFYYWGKKNKKPVEVLYRRKRLSLFTSRLVTVMEQREIKVKDYE